MGRYSRVIKCAEIRSLVDKGKYSKALEIVEQIEIEQVKVVTDLNAIAEVYMRTNHYIEAKEVYIKIFEKSKTRRVLCQLVYVSIKCGEIEEAEYFYNQYILLDPKGCDRRILRYRIDKAKGVDKASLILLLEQLKAEEYIEEWAYELAKLYHKEGRKEDCVRECSDIVLWFGEGVIVEKARLLKKHYLEGFDILSSDKIIKEEIRMREESAIQKASIEETEEKTEEEQPLEEIVPEETFDPLEIVLEEALGDKKPPHFIIIGDNQEERIQEAKLLAKRLTNQNRISNGKIAKISAERLNEILLEKNQEKLRGGCLFVEHAGDLSGGSVKSIIKMIDAIKLEIVVILGDEEEAIEWLLKKNKKLITYFQYRIYLEQK